MFVKKAYFIRWLVTIRVMRSNEWKGRWNIFEYNCSRDTFNRLKLNVQVIMTSRLDAQNSLFSQTTRQLIRQAVQFVHTVLLPITDSITNLREFTPKWGGMRAFCVCIPHDECFLCVSHRIRAFWEFSNLIGRLELSISVKGTRIGNANWKESICFRDAGRENICCRDLRNTSHSTSRQHCLSIKLRFVSTPDPTLSINKYGNLKAEWDLIMYSSP